jgi:hypothetical protein
MSSAYCRVFGLKSVEPAPAALRKFFGFGSTSIGSDLVKIQVQRDEQGWYRADIRWADDLVQIERYLASEEGIRAELNTWAAWVEATGDGAVQAWLMQRLIAAQQLFVVRELSAHPNVPDLCRYMAVLTDGVYQIDGQGFFRADGTLLVREDDEDDAGG